MQTMHMPYRVITADGAPSTAPETSDRLARRVIAKVDASGLTDESLMRYRETMSSFVGEHHRRYWQDAVTVALQCYRRMAQIGA